MSSSKVLASSCVVGEFCEAAVVSNVSGQLDAGPLDGNPILLISRVIAKLRKTKPMAHSCGWGLAVDNSSRSFRGIGGDGGLGSVGWVRMGARMADGRDSCG